MRIKLLNINPFGHNRYGFLWHVLHNHGPGRHLDYGCYDGNVLRVLSETGVIAQGVGVDLNANAISNGMQKMPSNVALQTIAKGQPLPFPDSHFDSVSLLDVIEHVVDQRTVLDDIQRVLVANGTLVITVPRRHVLSFLDAGNLKFMLPRLHGAYYSVMYGRDAYHRRYVECANGLFGDIEREKGWHQHFSEAEMTSLLEASRLGDCEFDGAGLFYRPLSIISHLLPKVARRPMRPLLEIDAKYFHSANLFCAAHKL